MEKITIYLRDGTHLEPENIADTKDAYAFKDRLDKALSVKENFEKASVEITDPEFVTFDGKRHNTSRVLSPIESYDELINYLRRPRN